MSNWPPTTSYYPPSQVPGQTHRPPPSWGWEASEQQQQQQQQQYVVPNCSSYSYQWPSAACASQSQSQSQTSKPEIPAQQFSPPNVILPSPPNQSAYNTGPPAQTGPPPNYNHPHIQQQQPSPSNNRSSGKWKRILMLHAAGSIVVLAINVIAAIFVVSQSPEGGIAAVYTGSCSFASEAVVWIGLAINVLSVVLTMGSSSCMQRLSAPTRRDVDKAHQTGRWLDVGVSMTSGRNFWAMGRGRRVLFCLLGASSIPLAVVYNASVFSGKFSNSYNYKVMDAEWLDWVANGTAPSYVRDMVPAWAANFDTWERLSNAECIRAYATLELHDRDNVIPITPQNDTVYYDYVQGQVSTWLPVNDASGIPNWICMADPDEFGEPVYTLSLSDRCPTDSVDKLLQDADHWTVGGYPISYCLSHRVPERCQVQASVLFLGLVIVCNVCKSLCLLASLRVHRQGEPLLVMGDAASSFLGVPDPTTEGSCLLSVADINKSRISLGPKRWTARRWFWAQAAGVLRFLVGLAFLLTFAILSIVFLQASARWMGITAGDIDSLWKHGFGSKAATRTNTFRLTSGAGYESYAFLANLPQLLVGAIFLLYTDIFSRMLFSSEFSSYSQRRHALQTTIPQGSQRSTSLISLPWAYAICFVVARTLLQWLTAQSIFSVSGRTIRNNELNPLDNTSDLIGLGFSPLAAFLAVLVAALLFVALVASGFRRYPAGSPLVTSNTLLIAANCHPTAGESPAAAYGELKWGVVVPKKAGCAGGEEVNHCGLSTMAVESPVKGCLYA